MRSATSSANLFLVIVATKLASFEVCCDLVRLNGLLVAACLLRSVSDAKTLVGCN